MGPCLDLMPVLYFFHFTKSPVLNIRRIAMVRNKLQKHGMSISLAISLLVLSSFACNLLADTTEQPQTPPPTSKPVVVDTPLALPTAAIEPTKESGPPSVGRETGDLAKATVQIFALLNAGGQWEVVWSGSGSVISSDGLILTNAHVVDNRYDEYSMLGVAMTDRTDQPPELEYLAEIVNVDYGLDLSVIRITSDLDGNSVTPNLPFISLGDSDQIEIGEKLRILGFPGIGGDTITFTEGAVSGFTQERGIEGRAWIKTDATIAGGNSGGMAANAEGALIGVPTRASSGGDQIVDCRPVADTNRDGYIDEYDTCVPIGGFINGLRPINLAKPLIEAALNSQEYVAGIQEDEMPIGDFDLSQTEFTNLVFADGVTENDLPTQLWYFMPSGTQQICAFWDYVGMVDGLVWSAYWFANGLLDEGNSLLEMTWQGGSEGNWWVCMWDEVGLADGTYELVLEVQGETMVSESIFVGSERKMIDFILINNSSLTVCFVQLSPTSAQGWGQDELASDDWIDPSDQRVIPLASGYYDILLSDCDGITLYEEYEIDLYESYEFTLID
jgi:serine protease Do